MNQAVTLFKHNPSAQDPDILEAITVQREEQINRLVEVSHELADARHQLLVGPRGMGKTHLLSIVASRVRGSAGEAGPVIAWIEEDGWVIRTYAKFLAAVTRLVAVELDVPELGFMADDLQAGRLELDDAEKALRDVLGERRLLLLVENLEQIFRKIGTEGQQRFRGFLESSGKALVLATATRRFDAVTDENAPFKHFFEITELEELTVDSAMELMRRIAKLNGDGKLLGYLSQERARSRFAAIETLAGGHPRIWLLFAGCISVEAIDELVPLFLKALDELTPYYQARLAELGDQQQELVVLLSETGGALSNRDLAERSGIAQNQVATMLRQLTERGYVRPAEIPERVAGGDNRMSFWELREPLMRLCLDVKKSRGEPLRMVIEFLRAWYGPNLLDELARLPAEAELATTYASEAFRSLGDEIEYKALLRGRPSEIVERAEIGLSLRPELPGLQITKAIGLMMDGAFIEARDELTALAGSAPSGLAGAAMRLQLAVATRASGGDADVGQAIDDLQVKKPEEAAGAAAVLSFAATTLSRIKEHDAALKAYEKAADLAPDEPLHQAGLGLTLVRLGREGEAIPPLERAVELAPKTARYHYRLGIALGRAERHAEALEHLDKATELEPKVVAYHSNRAVAYRNLGRLEESLEALESGLELAADDISLNERRARLLDELGRREEAVGAYERVLELVPEKGSVLNSFGALLGRMGRTEDALGAFEKALEHDGSKADYHANRGTALERLGRLEEALKAFERAAAVDPQNAPLQQRVGLALNSLGRLSEALEVFEHAVEIDATQAQIWNNRGVVLSDLDRFDEALASFAKAVELDPTNPTYVGNYGSSLGNLGRPDEALETFLAAIERNPEAAGLHRNRGFALNDLGRPEEAKKSLEEAIRIDRDDADAHNGLANSLRALEDLEGAEGAARRAIELQPTEVVFRFTLAEVLLAAGNFGLGIPALEEALEKWRGRTAHLSPGETDVLCQILWESRGDPRLPERVAKVVDAYGRVEAIDDLARGVVSSVPAVVDEASSEADAEAWVAAWAAAPAEELEIPVTILRAARKWKSDHDRTHLLSLPSEQREILIDLLPQ